MDAMHFNRLASALTDSPSRRGLVRGLTATTLGLTVLRLSGDVEAHKKRRSKKRCRRAGQSCSPGGKRKCCKGVICDDTSLDRFRCCKADGESCAAGSECCANECELGVCTPS